MDFNTLTKATVALNHLETNSAIHSDPFSAIAEFVDNSYDAASKNLYIEFNERTAENPHQTLEFLDDGVGMSRKEALQVITFGHSNKKVGDIGRYGVGLKSGAFHLGRDLFLLTKQGGEHTMMLISHKFHDDKNLKDSVFVPCPSFDENFDPVVKTQADKKKHAMEMSIIEQYAPYGKMRVRELFKKIPTSSGTLVIINQLRRSANGELMLNMKEHDIRNEGESLPAHRESLRTYLEILYLRPKMAITLRGEVVVPTKICASWMAKFKAEVPTSSFKEVFKKSEKIRRDEINQLEQDRVAILSDYAHVNIRGLHHSVLGNEHVPLNEKLRYLDARIDDMKKENEEVAKNFKNDIITVFCGVQTEKRTHDGVHFYINNRLITWGHKESSFFKTNKKSIGVSAYVNLNSSTFLPTASKQAFQDMKDLNLLVKKINGILDEYFEYFETHWITKNMKLEGDNLVEKFWNTLGYQSAFAIHKLPVEITDPKIASLKQKECPLWCLCSLCRVWRRDSQNRVTDPSKIVCCSFFNGRGCGDPDGDDEQFRMEMPAWKTIKMRMQNALEKKNRMAANASNRSVLSNSSLHTSNGSNPSSMTYPHSILKKSAAPTHPELPIPSSQISRPDDSDSLKTPKPERSASSVIDILDDYVESPRQNGNSSRQYLRRSGKNSNNMTPPTSQAPSTSAHQPRVFIESDAEDYDDVDEEINPEEIVFEPFSSNSKDGNNGGNVVEEDRPRRDPKPQAKRPMTKVNRRQRDSSDEDDESDDEVVPAKKSKEAHKYVAKVSQLNQKFSRAEVMENAINSFMKAVGEPSIPKKGEIGELNLCTLLERVKASKEVELERYRREEDQTAKDLKVLFDYIAKLPNAGVSVKRSGNVMNQLHDLANQIREKHPRTRAQKRK